MPGTIHVAVLEFKGASSSSKPSAKSLKVSMGKREYQTWDKGTFSFPITKIGENLVVALLDAGGNEIAHQDIQTMRIIEKGSWDEVFSINGGGHVHMKLQFSLSEEDRNRVRFMRESVMKKKLEMDPNIKLRLQEAVPPATDSSETAMSAGQKVSASAKGLDNIDLTRPKVEPSQAGSPPASSAVSLSSHQMDGGLILDGAIPNATDGSQSAPSSSPVRHEAKLQDEETEAPQAAASSKLPRSSMAEQGPVKKTPSSVRKMISAFESSQLQEVKTMKRAVSVPSQLNKVGKAAWLEERLAETVVSPPDKATMDDSEPPQAAEELASNERRTSSGRTHPSSSEQILHEGEESPSQRASSSGRRNEERKLTSKTVSSSVAEGAGGGSSLKSSTTIDIEVSHKTLQHYKEECQSGQTSGMWIFPNNTRRLCTTTAGEHVMKMVGRGHSEAKTHQRNKNSSEMQKNPMHEKEHKIENNSKKLHRQPESGPPSSPNGLVGQVIKIAVIVGFGVLVLLTRQKGPRKKHKEEEEEEEDNLFHTPECVDERTLKSWTGKQ